MKFKLSILVCLFILFSACAFSADNVKQGTNIDIKNAQNAVVAIYRTHSHIYTQNGKTYLDDEVWTKCKEGPNVAGSGFFINKDGYFLTCYHVFRDVEGRPDLDFIPTNPMNLTDKVEYMFVKTNDNKRVPFKVVDFDDYKDIALCKVLEGYEYPLIKLANSKEVEEASVCYSIGTPLTNALGNTITDGTISSTDRNISVLSGEKIPEEEKKYNYSFIQHSSPITHGNSGGPLLNEYGACIGINTSGIEGYESYGLAICINHAKGMIDSNNVEYAKWDGPNSKPTPDPEINNNGKGTDNKPVPNTPEEPDHDYTIYFIIGGALLLIIICIIIYFVIINNKKQKIVSVGYNMPYNQPKLNNHSNNQYKSKDNYDDIDIELL